MEEVCRWCESEGKFEPLEEIDSDRVRTMVEIAQSTLDFVQAGMKRLPRESPQWNAVFVNHYDVLQVLAEAILLVDRMKSSNHQCLFAFLCSRHHDLELDWHFFERVRTKRNGSHYYGVPASYEDWKQVEVQMNLYIRTLRGYVEKRLKKL